MVGADQGRADPATECHHATLSVLPPDQKGRSALKVVELLSPPATIELKNTGIGTVHWEWSFVRHERRFDWPEALTPQAFSCRSGRTPHTTGDENLRRCWGPKRPSPCLWCVPVLYDRRVLDRSHLSRNRQTRSTRTKTATLLPCIRQERRASRFRSSTITCRYARQRPPSALKRVAHPLVSSAGRSSHTGQARSARALFTDRHDAEARVSTFTGQAQCAMITLLSFLDPLFDAPPAAASNSLDSRTATYLESRDGSGDPGRRASGGVTGDQIPLPVASSAFGLGRLMGANNGKGRELDHPPVPPRPPLPVRDSLSLLPSGVCAEADCSSQPPNDPNEIEIMDFAHEEEDIHRALRLLEVRSLWSDADPAEPKLLKSEGQITCVYYAHLESASASRCDHQSGRGSQAQALQGLGRGADHVRSARQPSATSASPSSLLKLP